MMLKFNSIRFRGRFALLLSAACLGVITSYSFPASAMTLVATNLAQMSESAESAFIIRIDTIQTTTSQGRPCDVITGSVIEPVFGDVQTSQTKSWNQFRLGPGFALPGMPAYEVGKEYLIFLSGKSAQSGFQSPVGMGQGSFKVLRNPKAGTTAVRNIFGNRTLSSGLNLEAAASDIVAKDTKTRGMSPNQRKSATDKLKTQLRGNTQNSLGAIKDAARFFHYQKELGRKPSQDYRTSAPVHVLR